MANQNQLSIYPPGLKTPPGFSNSRQPGEIEILFNSNKKDIYHRFSPYTEEGSLLGFGKKQPYVWRYPDEKNKGFGRRLPKSLRILESLNISPLVSGADDVERMSEWLTSGYGVQYTIKQALLQSYQPFNETSIYNPLSPMIATISPLSLGLIDRPTRFIDQGSLLGGLLSTLGLKGFAGGTVDALLGKAIGRSPYTTIAPGSVGSGGFFGFRFGSTSNQTNPLSKYGSDNGKGLMRGKTALAAESRMMVKWGGTSESISSLVRKSLDSLIPNILPRKIDATYRADEKFYQTMVSDPNGFLSYTNSQGAIIPITQMWFATSKANSANFSPAATLQFKRDNHGSYVIGKTIDGYTTGYSLSGNLNSSDLIGGKLGAIFSGILGGITTTVRSIVAGIGLPIPLSGPMIKGQRRYSDSVGITNDTNSLKNSDALVNYSRYLDSNSYVSKQSDPTSPSVISQQENLRKVLNKINSQGTYQVNVPRDSVILSSGNNNVLGYNSISSRASLFQNRINGVSKEYNSDVIPVLDHSINTNIKTMRMSAANYPDGMNQLGILPKSKNTGLSSGPYIGWTKWDPYKDDLIAFFFYDVVNEKYIPFRATIKGINESGQAEWEELKFIGRADRLYSYSGFQRSLNFSFSVVISSITELLPTWKRINYIAGAIEPSNYTKIGSPVYNRFMVPPMFMITVGDLYKFQPIIITSVTVTVPDDATWETLNEINSPNDWKYLNGYISNRNLNKKYAQLPKEADITITCNLLKKERAIVGSANFGHAPHDSDYEKDLFVVGSDGKPYLPEITEFSRQLIEYNGNAESSNDNRTVSGPGSTTKTNITQQSVSTSTPTSAGNSFSLLSKPQTPSIPDYPVSNVKTNNVSPIFP